MLGPAAIALAVGAHTFGIKVTIQPDPVPVASPDRRRLIGPGMNRGALLGRFLVRMAVRVIAAHAPVSPTIAAYQEYVPGPALENFRIPANVSAHPQAESPARGRSICLQQAASRLEARICNQ